jgi:membrane dipeptidase
VGAAGERADTFPFVVDLRGTHQFLTLIRLLEERGHSQARIEKILGRNFIEYAARIWAS